MSHSNVCSDTATYHVVRIFGKFILFEHLARKFGQLIYQPNGY